jgi:hypothetical protein
MTVMTDDLDDTTPHRATAEAQTRRKSRDSEYTAHARCL